jgi:hypothetical protein
VPVGGFVPLATAERIGHCGDSVSSFVHIR